MCAVALTPARYPRGGLSIADVSGATQMVRAKKPTVKRSEKPRRTFRAEGHQIWARPIYVKKDGYTQIKIGFPIAVVNDNIEQPEKVAKLIAKAMNASRSFG